MNVDQADLPDCVGTSRYKYPDPWVRADLAVSAQVVDEEKYMAPRKSGALTRDVFEVAGMGSVHEVDHLIFDSCTSFHVRPCEECTAW